MYQPSPTLTADRRQVLSLLVDMPCTRLATADWNLAQLHVRGLEGGDLAEVERHLLALDPMSRRARFGSAFADTSVVAYVSRIDLHRALLVGAFDGSSGIVGLAEAQPTSSSRRVEMAVSVHVPYRLKGLGRHLVVRAMNEAFSRGAEVAEFQFARDNRAIVGLIRALGGRFSAMCDHAEISSPNPPGCGA
jgi:GNAT superfamily N-acetyltransferase